MDPTLVLRYFGSSMKWLQWSPVNLESSLGGVEVHGRSLVRELRKLGVQAEFSTDNGIIWAEEWDVIHTHGSLLFFFERFKSLFFKRPKGRPLWVHTFHGLTHERMLACRELLWPGGYAAILREILGSTTADIIFSVHPELSIFKNLQERGKPAAVCSNGWDSWGEAPLEPLPTEFQSQLKEAGDFWAYIGRGEDRVKDSNLLISAIHSKPSLKVVAVPGSGFESEEKITRLGMLNSSQIRSLLHKAQGLVLTSKYEGMPLVVLEALAEGVPVVATKVGGLKTLSPSLEGLFLVEARKGSSIAGAMEEAARLPNTELDKVGRAYRNRALLSTWRDVAQTVHDHVKQALQSRKRA